MKIINRLTTLSLTVMLCVATQLQAADVDLATAQNAAKAFMSKQVANGRLRAAAATNLQLVKAEASVAKPNAVDYYIFNSDKSYIVIAGDDKAPQVLMYGATGRIDINNIPPAMQWLLNKYKYQIDGIKAGTMEPIKASTRATTAIAPLVTATWDQSEPYWNHTPTSGSTHTYTGCPATSLSMCFYKWKWPEKYPALDRLTVSGGVTASALSEMDADWDNIVDHYGTWYDDNGTEHYASYTDAQAEAVSWLMRYVGQACQMQYTTSGSGANDPEIHQACLTMGYTDAQLLTLYELVQSGSSWNPSYSNGPAQYSDTEWNNYMMTELQNGRPIEYLAYDITNGQVSGHAFNVFGCDNNGKYYVNWGWSGVGDAYCTLHNFVASMSATGQSGSYTFKYGEAMIIGIEPPAGALTNPKISVNPSTLTMNTTLGTPITSTITVTGANLTDKVNVTLTDANGVFSVTPTSVSVNEATNGKTITVTFTPQAVGSYTGSIKLSSTDASDVTVTLNGTATLKKENIVLQEAANVASTSFQAIWNDQTPDANVVSYTMWVNQKKPVELLSSLDGSQYTGSYTTITLTSPWGGTRVYGGYNAVYFGASGNITFTIPEGYNNDTFSVRIISSSRSGYGSGNLTVKSAKTAAAGHTFSDGETYTWLVTGSTGDKITITTTDNNYSPDMVMIEVYAGDASQLSNKKSRGVAEEGDETYRIITGITAKTYTVNNLTPEATYYFKVKAIYVDGTESPWSDTKQVTLLEDTDTPNITATPSSVDFGTCYIGQSSEQTFTVTGKNLTGDITATLTDPNNVFALNSTSITTTEAINGKAIKVTFNPTAIQNYTGSIKLSSAGTNEVIINLTGKGTLFKAVPVMAAANEDYIKHTSFRADWTDETPEANVESYTLEVTPKPSQVESILLEDADFSSLSPVTNSSSQLTNVASTASLYLPTGWTAQNGLWINSGYIISGYLSSTTCGITSPTYDLTGYDKVTVVMSAYSYYSSYYGEATIRVKTSAGSQEVVLATDDFTTYTLVLDAAESDQVVFEGVSNMFAIEDIKIYAGDYTQTVNLLLANEQGDSTQRTITGITDHFYTVNDLTGGGTFYYRVKAIYTDNTESDWSNVEMVTLNANPDTDWLLGDVDGNGEVNVTDVNILVNIILGKDNAASYDGRADVDGNGNVDITDVNQVVNIILGKNPNAKAPRKAAVMRLLEEPQR